VQAIDVYGVDPARVEGITGFRRVDALASHHNKTVNAHAWSTAITTAASLHQATGLPVAMAFDAGNLGPVCKALRKAYPACMLVLCGDDDVATQGNPGRTKATAAALAAQGLAVFPAGLPTGASDFNDMHQHHGGAAGQAFEAIAVERADAGEVFVAGRASRSMLTFSLRPRSVAPRSA
jgi:phage/plasmid primase-like uncharacterized protein